MSPTTLLPGDLGSRAREHVAPSKLAHIVFRTPRLRAMTQWYQTVLSSSLVFDDGRLAFLTYDAEHHRIALVRVPAVLRLPGTVWRYYRKFWGLDHIAFTYSGLGDLMSTYRRLRAVGIEPVWCINHGPTTSMYYEDPDGHRVELQVENFATTDELLRWLDGGEFSENPIGVEFDPDVMDRLLISGVPEESLLRRGAAPPGRRPARSGFRTLRWRTL